MNAPIPQYVPIPASPAIGGKSNGAHKPMMLDIMSAAELCELDLPPVSFIVPGYITEGLTVLAGRPKTGKSWLLLGLAIAVASGTPAFGSVPVEQGDVLYLALEDNQRRLQRRLRQMLPHGGIPERLAIATACPRLDDGGVDAVRQWLDTVPEPRLVVVDVFNMVRPQNSANDSVYEADYRALGPIKQLADERGIAIVLLHHTRKMGADDVFDTVSGSTGLTGAADSVLVLLRDTHGVTLHGRGRDLEEFETTMRFDPVMAAWSILGAASEVRRSDERGAILDALKQADEPLGPKDLEALTGCKSVNLRKLLAKMVKAGEAEKARYGRYIHPARHDLRGAGHTGHTDHTGGNDHE